MILPESWAVVLQVFAPVFARRGTFRMFTVLATGMVAATGRRTVVGMLAGAGMARQLSFHAACRFFSSAVWDADRLGLAAARFIVDHLLDPQAPIVVAVDDTLFRRWGSKIHNVFWTHDGSAQGKTKIGRGNRWIVAGIVVRLPFCTAAVCLPVLLRLWAGKGSDSPVTLGSVLLQLIGDAFPGRVVHGSGTRPTTVRRCWWQAPPGRPGYRELLAVRLGTATDRQAWPAPAEGRQAAQAQGHGGHCHLGPHHGLPVPADRDRGPGRDRSDLVRAVRQHPRARRSGPRRRLGQGL
jgi:hypothetical protein